jgi:Cu/Ag efflux protein CusF
MANHARHACGLTLMLVSAMVFTHSASVRAQEPGAATTPPAAGVGITIDTTARVVHIDPSTNTVTLRGPNGNVVDVDVDPQVGNVNRLAIGDLVHISYREAVLLSVAPVDKHGIRSSVETRTVVPASGGNAAASTHVAIVATIQRIDAQKRRVTLRGPKRTVTVEVGPNVALEKLHVGDSIRADYVIATAVHIVRDGDAGQ